MQFKALAFLSIAFAAATVEAATQPYKRVMKMFVPNKDGIQGSGLSCESTPTTGAITNAGGPIMNGTVNVYMIWYGSWSTNQTAVLQNLATNIGASPYFNVEKTYGVSGPVVMKKSVFDSYSQGKTLTDALLPKIVSNSIKKLKLPNDPNGLYFINTDPTVTETGGFCTQYCGFHTNAVIGKNTLKYAFIGNPAQSTSCLQGCAPCNVNTSPNGDLGVDAMASIFAHEMVEALSDPLGTTWHDAQGYENADKCAYTYGSTSKTTTGAYYNMNIGGMNYLIQQNWKATGGCAKQ